MIVSAFAEREETAPVSVVCIRPGWASTPMVVCRASSQVEAEAMVADLWRHPDLCERWWRNHHQTVV